MTMVKLEQVFGVSKNQILSYVERPRVDGLFLKALKSDKQIIVYGSSKQGKTALVDKHAPYRDNLIVRCTPTSDLIDLYKSLLRQLNVELITESQSGQSSSTGTEVNTKIKAKLPLFGSVEGGGVIKAGSASEKTQTRETIEFNLALPQDISELVKKIDSEKFVILENFHYLNDDVQRRFAFDLRTFQELGIRFIILGVWREKNRLAQFNGDLLDRIIEVPVEPWEHKEFEEVIQQGEGCLRVKFSNELVKAVIENAFDSIGVVQELLLTICQLGGVTQTCAEPFEICDTSLLIRAIEAKVDDYSARHVRALESIAEGRRSNKPKDGVSPLYLPYYTVRAFLTFDFRSVVSGIRRDKLEEEIKKQHHRPNDVRSSDMSNLLHSFAKLQSEKDIVPPIFDYDLSTKTMRVVDSTFYFFLRNVDRSQILRDLADPTREVS